MLTQDVLIISAQQISITIAPQENEVKAVEICQLLRRLKNNNFMEINDNIVKAADMINQASREGVQNTKDTVIISKAMHATLSVDVVKEDMKAVITISAPWGGEHITLPHLNQHLEEHGIVSGICIDTFPEKLKEASRLQAGQTLTFDGALGKLPIDGTNASFDILVKTMEDRKLTPQGRSHGKVDMHDLGEVETVGINAPLVRRTPPTNGESGYTIFGTQLPATPGENIPFKINDGTQLCPSDENLLISLIEGVPRLHNESIAINDVLTVKNVDISFGNIEFKGNVIVKGDVCEGMTVISNGNITVEGCVNSATLQADGHIHVAQGIFGKKRKQDESLTCLVTAGGEVSAQYIQYSQIESGDTIRAQTQLLHSKVSAKESVIVANNSLTKGTIFGGEITASKKISAVELGGNAGSKTKLVVHANLDKERDEIDSCQQLLAKEFIVLQQLIAAHDKVSSIKTKEGQQQLLNKLKRNIDKKVALIVDNKKVIASAQSSIDEQRMAMSIVAKGTLFDGVHVTLDNQSSQTLEQYKAIKITIDHGAINIAALS